MALKQGLQKHRAGGTTKSNWWKVGKRGRYKLTGKIPKQKNWRLKK